jgi:uncharacterized membrane protein
MADLEKREIEQLVRQIDPNFLATLSKPQREQLLVVTSRIVERSTSFSGPLPPADMLIEYNQAVPDGAERIFVMTEKQAAHRQRLEASVITSQNKQSHIGQVFAFILAILLIAVGTYAIHVGATAVASVIFGTTIAALTAVFVIGKNAQKKDLGEKQKQN